MFVKADKKQLRILDPNLIDAYKRLEESEERFQLAMKVSNDGLFDWNLKTNSIYYSPGWKRMLGYEDCELPNDFSVWEKLIEPEAVKRVYKLQKKLINKETDRFVTEFKMKHKDGYWVDILSRAEAVFDKHGVAIRIVGTHVDVTEQNKVKAKLIDSKNYLSAVFNHTQDIQILSEYVSHRRFKIVAVNKSFLTKLKQFGIDLSEQDFLGKDLKKLVLDILCLDEKICNYILNNYQKVIETDKKISHTEKIILNNSPYYSETIYIPIHNSEDGTKLVLYNSSDITKEKVSLKKLRCSEERFALAVKGSHDAIWDWSDLDSDLYWWSDRFYEILGYQPGEVEARISNWIKWMHPEDSGKVLEALANHFEKNDAYEVEFRMKKKNGEYVWLFARGESVRDEDGKPVRMAGSVSDITDRKRTEDELIKAKNQAEESDRLKSAFLANMSHEIRTPMNGILGFAELLKTPKIKSVKKEKYIDIIGKSGKRMLNIINDIIDISKIESGSMELKLSDSNVNEQVEYIYTFYKREVEEKGLMLQFHNGLPWDEALVTTDREKLFAILTNLVKNAIKCTKKGIIEFGYLKKNNDLEFFVRDTGHGVPKHRMGAIFDRFVQAENIEEIDRQGVGLGLSITKSYIDMLGGKIWLESEEDFGSTFYFTIPYQILSEEEKLKKTGKNGEDYNELLELELNVIIAEDDAVSSALLAHFMEKYSSEIRKVNTGVEVVEVCKNVSDIDLILMDMRMPKLNGYEATRNIRKFNKDVVIIAQTAYGLSGDREKAIDSGCNDYLAKPIGKNALVSLLHKYFGNGRSKKS
ncbi:PAS domain-containing hybrid sensor histidine kinase/response regulator [Marinifilum sp. D714]|uniref:PAS domain-containing hybrid sensor histidine kinase/response regulator n=1 Tax=Marinifilum sp. D714 TaxID=2937523 RepID=UPI0027C7FFD4|nr:PAS domain-containing hybrid sensor histidine kinase/response regulator [Marinifilum sp. D714]MDQ2177570.1 PAS domain-containing protein [Marinifilum sp. D714]